MNLFDVGYYKREVSHHASTAARWTGGFAIRQLMNIFSGGGSVNLALITRSAVQAGQSPWTTFVSHPLAYGFGLVSLGLGVGVRGWLEHRDWNHRREDLADLYRKEIAAKLGKAEGQVQGQDLEILAEKNATFAEELDRSRKKMHLGTVAYAIGAVVSLAAVMGAVMLLPLAAGALGWFGALAVGVTTGYFAQKITEDTVHSIGERVLEIDGRSMMDRVRHMERRRELGYEIKAEQVMELHVAANPQLAMNIRKDPQFGQSFDRLTLKQKHEAILTHGKDLNIKEVTDALNSGRMRAQELTFRIHDDESGAHADPTLYHKVQEKLSGVKKTLDNSRLVASQKWDGLISQFSSSQKAENTPALDTAAEKSWVTSMGLNPPTPLADQLGGWAARRDAELASLNTPRTIN